MLKQILESKNIYEKIYDLLSSEWFSDKYFDVFADVDYSKDGVLVGLNTHNVSKAIDILQNVLFKEFLQSFEIKEVKKIPNGFYLNDEYPAYLLIK